MSSNRHLLLDRCYVNLRVPQTGRATLMKLILLFTALVAPLAGATFDGGIQGRVLNVQGGPVAGATVTVTTKDEKPRAKVITAADGSYAISNLEPGAYTVTVSLANIPQILRLDVVVVDDEPVPTRADFRVTAEDTQGVAGLE